MKKEWEGEMLKRRLYSKRNCGMLEIETTAISE